MRRRPLPPPQVLALGMAGVILVGTLLLVSPWAAADGVSIGPLAALFTATSAVCVTGLIVVDTPVALSGFGQAVLLLLIQVGGLGYMTMSTVIVFALGRRLSISDGLTLQASFNLESRRDLLQFTLTVLKLTLVFELVGALVLTARWWGEFGLAGAAWQGVFHAVSAFNNAGFSLFSTSLVEWRGDPVVNLTVMALVVSGGIGYLVLTELLRYRRERRLSLHTRFVLILTAALVTIGTVGFFLTERGNPATLGALPAGDAWLTALFQSVTTRTAGFNSIDIGQLRPAALFLMLAFMFIGGAPGGTAGGVKVSTFGVTVLALWATIRGARDATLLGRRLPVDLVARSFFICLIGFLALNVGVGALLVFESRELLPTLVETTSAFGTVGLSMGSPGSPLSLSGSYSAFGQVLICVLMFTGRIGPLTLAFALAGRRQPPRVRYPEERVLIG
ncbi:MAG TPA: potassium transporter TrkG [Vicinamibacterales bacterium]|nr:potassium transporter TrkG [Vicinamibacterales bacterium]